MVVKFGQLDVPWYQMCTMNFFSTNFVAFLTNWEFLLSSVILIKFSRQFFDIKELGGGGGEPCKPHINFTNETQNWSMLGLIEKWNWD